MSMRISKSFCTPLLLAALAACSGSDSGPTQQAEGGGAAKQAAADGKVECALAGATAFERICSTEQISTNGSILLVLRHPDGGFRRFNILTDGRGLAAADGFDDTRISLLEGSMIELSSGDDKYRLPAQIKNSAPAEATTLAKDAS